MDLIEQKMGDLHSNLDLLLACDSVLKRNVDSANNLSEFEQLEPNFMISQIWIVDHVISYVVADLW